MGPQEAAKKGRGWSSYRTSFVSPWAQSDCPPPPPPPPGILLPLCESGTCTLREAIILGSIITKCSIPVLHSR